MKNRTGVRKYPSFSNTGETELWVLAGTTNSNCNDGFGQAQSMGIHRASVYPHPHLCNGIFYSSFLGKIHDLELHHELQIMS